MSETTSEDVETLAKAVQPHAVADVMAADQVSYSEALRRIIAAHVAKVRAEALREAANAIGSALPVNCELRPDGSTDPVMATYVEGFHDAFDIVSNLADRIEGGEQPKCACVGYTIRTDYGTGTEHDVDRSSCPIHAAASDD